MCGSIGNSFGTQVNNLHAREMHVRVNLVARLSVTIVLLTSSCHESVLEARTDCREG